MVSTRVVIAISAFILLLATGSEWVAFESNSDQFGYTTFDIGSVLGSAYGPCGCPPSNSSIDGQFWLITLPLLIAPGALALGAVAFPIGFVLAVVSLFRWRVMVVAGVFAFVGGSSWIGGIGMDQTSIVHGLDGWWGYGGRTVSSAVWAPLGPYLAVVGGAVLVLGYALSVRELLDYPID